MFLTTEAPDELLYDGTIPGVFTGDGCVLEALEEVPAGPWLAVVIDSIDPSRLTSWELPAYLRACSRVEAWAAARKTATVAEMAGRPDACGPDKEIGQALREPVGAAQTRVYFSRRLLRLLPQTWRLFRHGELTEKQAMAVAKGASGCDDSETLAKVEERVLGKQGATGKTPEELRRDARQALNRLDPDGAQGRARAARDQADVVLHADEDGMADVGVHAPVEQAALIKSAADAYAATAKNAGDQRRIGVLRVEGLARIAGAYLDGDVLAGSRPRSAGLPVEVGVVVGLRTALGLADVPGEVPGLGIVPREVVAELIAREQAKLRLMVIDEESGRLLYRAESSYRPKPAQIAHVRAAYVYSTGPGSQVLAGRTDTGHVPAWPEGPTQIGHLVPKDRTWHEAVTKGEVKVSIDDGGTVFWTTVSGQTRTVTPYDFRLEDPGDQTQTTPPADPLPPPF
ncbi:MAG TPA: DUF222 domain-containing protein [Mycobacteriales bacterium]|nr:DUF222 domain-containing protein [Mycobacteriales bacterium]